VSRQGLGRAGEAIARACYEAAGYEILAERYRRGRGELDLVVARGDLVAFVEVKTRRGDRCGDAASGVTPLKLRRMRGTARRFLDENPRRRARIFRFDVAAVDFSPDLGDCRVTILRGVL